jgi:hypothetical protein
MYQQQQQLLLISARTDLLLWHGSCKKCSAGRGGGNTESGMLDLTFHAVR